MTNEGLAGLIAATSCKVWLYPEDGPTGPLVGLESGLKLCALPSLEWMLYNEEQERYPYDKTFEEAKWDEIVIIHTSGTTGKLTELTWYLDCSPLFLGEPKPIFHTNGMWSVNKNVPILSRRHWPRGIQYESWIGKTSLNPCPPQWIAGLHAMILSPVFLDSSCVMMPRDEVSLTPTLFKKIMSLNRIEGIRCPPFTINGLYADLETQQMLKSLDFIVYTGAPLDRAIGDDLCQHTRLSPLIGSTENGDQIGLRPADRKLWYTHDFVPENGHRMVPLDAGSDDLHELILENVGDGRINPFQSAFWNTGHRFLERIETKELYRPVKDSDGRTRWAFSARKDDLTKLSWLAKFHAQDIERRILQHPDVQNVLVGGEARPAPYVIVQAKEGVLNGKSEGQLLDELYNGVVAATNKTDMDEIRIPRETVMIAKKEKPLKVSLKQLVQRKAVEQDYSEEIEQAYVRLENSRKP